MDEVGPGIRWGLRVTTTGIGSPWQYWVDGKGKTIVQETRPRDPLITATDSGFQTGGRFFGQDLTNPGRRTKGAPFVVDFRSSSRELGCACVWKSATMGNRIILLERCCQGLIGRRVRWDKLGLGAASFHRGDDVMADRVTDIEPKKVALSAMKKGRDHAQSRAEQAKVLGHGVAVPTMIPTDWRSLCLSRRRTISPTRGCEYIGDNRSRAFCTDDTGFGVGLSYRFRCLRGSKSRNISVKIRFR